MDRRTSTLKWDEQGLLPAVVQDDETGDVLMVAYMSRAALDATLRTGYAHFWSRSRKRLWKKGETSGNSQEVREIRLDCDADTVLLRVKPKGPACHTGKVSCFFRKASSRRWVPVKNSGDSPTILNQIYSIIEERRRRPTRDSYVAALLKSGRDKILKKIGEEAGEMMIASKNGNKDEIIHETADLWFHGLVLLGHHGITPDEIYKELRRRFGVSGLKEKRSRVKRRAKR